MGSPTDIPVLGLSVVVWLLALYSLRVAVFGDPLCAAVAGADAALLRRAGLVMRGGDAPGAGAPEAVFLRRFTRLGMLELAASLAEVATLAFLLRYRMLPWLAVALLAKTFVLLALEMWFVRRRRAAADIFEQLRRLPAWYLWLDRGAALASALGLVAMFLAVNGFWGGG